MRIIGVDPGTICCGYGIIESGVKSSELRNDLTDAKLRSHNSKLLYVTAGDIKLKKKDPLPDRLKILHDSLNAIMNEYRPSSLCLEKIFYHKSIRSAFALGSTRGVVLLLAAEHGVPVFEYNPTELKMALTGYGRAEKRQVQEMVKRILNITVSSPSMSQDSTDALALCICHMHSSTYK